MKTIILTLFTVVLLTAQERNFKFIKEGFTDYVVIPVDGKSNLELYNRTIEWIKYTYKKPNEVIKDNIQNESITIEGLKPNILCKDLLGLINCDDMKYRIEISFKDSKYKFDVVSIEGYTKPNQGLIGGWYKIPLNDDFSKTYFKPNGKIKKFYKAYPDAFESTFNELNKSLEYFLASDKLPAKNKNW